jgi:hypothetical protein
MSEHHDNHHEKISVDILALLAAAACIFAILSGALRQIPW